MAVAVAAGSTNTIIIIISNHSLNFQCIACVKKAVASASLKGHVLCGYPSSKVQVRALQDLKVLTDKFVVLRGDPDKVREALLAEVRRYFVDN